MEAARKSHTLKFPPTCAAHINLFLYLYIYNLLNACVFPDGEQGVFVFDSSVGHKPQVQGQVSTKQEYKKLSARLAHVHYNITKYHNPVSLCLIIG